MLDTVFTARKMKRKAKVKKVGREATQCIVKKLTF